MTKRVKHEDDIWWEVRKSEKTLDAVLVKEKDSIPKIEAVSKLHVPTTAYVKVLLPLLIYILDVSLIIYKTFFFVTF